MNFTNTEIRTAIDECIHNDMHRDMLKMRLIDGWTYERIAEAVDRSDKNVSYIIRRFGPLVFEFLYHNRFFH